MWYGKYGFSSESNRSGIKSSDEICLAIWGEVLFFRIKQPFLFYLILRGLHHFILFYISQLTLQNGEGSYQLCSSRYTSFNHFGAFLITYTFYLKKPHRHIFLHSVFPLDFIETWEIKIWLTDYCRGNCTTGCSWNVPLDTS